MTRLALLWAAAGMVVLCLSSRAAAGAKETYDELYSKEEKAAIDKGPQAQAGYAAALLKDAKVLGEQKDLQVLLCEKAFGFGMKDPSGYQTAIDATILLAVVAPDQKGSAVGKRIEALQLGFAKGPVAERERFGKELVDLLVARGDEQAAAEQGADAIASYNKALEVANRANFGQAEDIKEKIHQITIRAEGKKRLTDLRKKLEENPKSAAARTNLIVAYLGEFDTPAEAVKLLTDDLDEKIRTYVPLSAKPVADLEEAACPELANWYTEIAEKASPNGKGVLLGKGLACCERYLELHTAQDAARLKVTKLREMIAKAMEKAGPEFSKFITLELGKGVAMRLVLIPAGNFVMGSPGTEDDRLPNEGPQRVVTIIKPFYMGVFDEVTQDQYQTVMGNNPSAFKDAKNPVEQVSWNDAVEFDKKLSAKTGKKVRLPTEAQWEYACRAGTKTRFGFGDKDADLGNYAWSSANSGGRTHPVGQKKPNAWGLYDMHGNVWEWCSDWFADSYANAGTRDTQGVASGTLRVLRGGSWYGNPLFCRSARRNGNSPGSRHGSYGFRVAVDLK
ncbi:MAG: formylglycine-generating enzyme family protein [Planctomycetota bacterium]|nr:formylglycine-generating enzyme family protein [Planctomycetota bacterium]